MQWKHLLQLHRFDRHIHRINSVGKLADPFVYIEVWLCSDALYVTMLYDIRNAKMDHQLPQNQRFRNKSKNRHKNNNNKGKERRKLKTRINSQSQLRSRIAVLCLAFQIRIQWIGIKKMTHTHNKKNILNKSSCLWCLCRFFRSATYLCVCVLSYREKKRTESRHQQRKKNN